MSTREEKMAKLAEINLAAQKAEEVKAKEIAEAQAAMAALDAELNAQFNALVAEFNPNQVEYKATNAAWLKFMDETVEATLNSLQLVVEEHVSKTCDKLANVVFNFTVNGTDINYSVLYAQIKFDKELNKKVCKGYHMHQHMINQMFKASNTFFENAIIGKTFKVVYTVNENNYHELKVVELA